MADVRGKEVEMEVEMAARLGPLVLWNSGAE